jgi:hypothetical protein
MVWKEHTIGKRWAIVPFAILIVAIAFGILARELVLYGARSVLGRWDEAGLPGRSPIGDGLTLEYRWPPRVSWRDLAWTGDGGVRLSCKRLEIDVSPWALLRGKVAPASVSVQDLDVSGAGSIVPWTALILETAEDSSAASEHTRPKPLRDAVRFDVSRMSFGDSTRGLTRLYGWAWSPKTASWALMARGTVEYGRSFEIRGSGSAAGGSGDLTLEVDLARGRTCRVVGRHARGSSWGWSIAGRDDGVLTAALLERFEGFPISLRDGTIDFAFTRSPSAGLEGDAQIQDVEVLLLGVDSHAPGSTADLGRRANGQVCFYSDGVRIEELEIIGRNDRTRIDADLPVGGDSLRSGTCAIAGSWSGSPFHLEGKIQRSASGIVLETPLLEIQGRNFGPAEFRLQSENEAGRSASTCLRGSMRIGSGHVALEVGDDGAGGLLVLRGSAIPISALEPLLPFPAPGKWSGYLDGDVSVCSSDGRARWVGTTLLSNGQVRGIPLLDQIEALRGGSGDGALRFDRLSASWSYELGQFFADSLMLSSPTMTVRGALSYSSSDSLLAMLRISPGTQDAIGSLLRLFGGNSAALELGITGRTGHPAIEVLDARSRSELRSRLDSVRRARRGI